MHYLRWTIPLAFSLALFSQQKASTPGVKTPGVQIPMTLLKPDATFDVPGAPDWMAIGESVWVSNKPKNSVTRIDPKTNKAADVVPVGNKPCSGLALGFGSLWVPNCGDHTLARVDLKTYKITASISTGIGDSEGGLAVSPDSVWLMTDKNGTLARIDPGNNKIVAEIYVARDSYTLAFGEGAVWVTSTGANLVSRVDPNTNLVTDTIPVGKAPRFLAVGEGAVWTLNQTDGTVSRIDPKTNKVVATIEVGVPGEGGDIAAGEGFVWVTSIGIPLSRIDPATNKVVQQFIGEGGDAIRVGLGSVWLTHLQAGKVWRLDPKRIAATLAE